MTAGGSEFWSKVRVKSLQRLLITPSSDTSTQPAATADASETLIDDTKLADLVKWAGTGFALLGGVATFFGIKDGNLDSILRIHPYQALFVACLTMVGVVGALVASAAKSLITTFTWVVVACALLVLSSSFIFTDLASGVVRAERGIAFYGILLATSVTIIVLFGKVPLSLVASGVLIAVCCVCIGLYGAVKLSIISKINAPETHVIARLTASDQLTTLDVNVASERLPSDAGLTVRIDGIRIDGPHSTLLQSAFVQPSSTGSIDAALSFPIDRSLYTEFVVYLCHGHQKSTSRNCDEYARLASTGGGSSAPATTGSIVVTDDGITAAVKGQGIKPSQVHALKVRLVSKTTRLALAKTVVVADVDGQFEWTTPITVQKGADSTLLLVDRACRNAIQPSSCSARTVVAKLHVP